MKIYAASDHAGFALKGALVDEARKLGHEVIDLGPDSDARVDYPDFGVKVGRAVAKDAGSLGLLSCGTGIGITIAANKVAGVRAACVWDEATAALARQHNDANVVAIGARTAKDEATARAILRAFLAAKFEGGRHADRVKKLDALDAERAAGR